MNAATGASVVGLSYDVQGNLSDKNGQAYTFSQGNRLRSVANKEWYAYDGYGRRVIACGSAACNYQLYSQLGQLLYTQDARKGINTDYIYLAGSVVAMRTRPAAGGAESVTYQHTDALGSPVATTNAAGQVVERTQYEPYGAAIGKTVDGVGYTGHAMDGGTGLIYMQQRYYDPTIPRFLSVDPIAANAENGTGFNRYAYAADNPFRFIDPDGREEREPKDSRSLASHSSNLGRMTTSTRSFASVLGQRAKTPSSQAKLIEGVGGDVNALAQARSTHEEFVGAIIGLATGGGLGGGTRTTSLFRAVGPDELADIKAMSAFRNLGSAEGKYFTTSASDASAYARQAVRAFGDQPYTIVSTKVPTSIFKGLSPATVDRGIPAWVIPTERLPGLVPHIMNNSPLPPTGF